MNCKTWEDFIEQEKKKEYYKKMELFLDSEKEKGKEIYPTKENVFNCFKLTPLNNVKVVILGQDPYHEPNQAHGLAFSVTDNIKIPPSLKNIYKELHEDLGIEIPSHGNLEKLAREGVLLLNTTMTVERGKANSHSKIGWNIFTDNVIKLLNNQDNPIIFVLWGNNARSKKILITNNKHFIIEGVHPSPLSAHKGFLGSKVFSKINDILIQNNKTPINWNCINE